MAKTQINGRVLTEGQKMTLWEALTIFVRKMEAAVADADVPMTPMEVQQLDRGREMVAMWLGDTDG